MRPHTFTPAELNTNAPEAIMRERITQAVARTLALSAIADAWEDEDGASDWAWPEDFQGAGPGEDWDDIVPEGAPEEAVAKAREIVRDFEARNGRDVVSIGEDWDTAANMDCGYPEDDDPAQFEWSDEGPERFGHCLALQALGAGVGLSDDIRHGVEYTRPETGLFEFHAWDFDLAAFLTN